MTKKKGYKHEWVDGVCQKCGKPCDHEWECETGICIKCHVVCEHKKWAYEDTDADSPVYECWYCRRCGYVFGAKEFLNKAVKMLLSFKGARIKEALSWIEEAYEDLGYNEYEEPEEYEYEECEDYSCPRE